MDLSQIKMVVSDMDGTLLNSKHQVSNRFYELFEKLTSKGILFTAASGRQFNSMQAKLSPIKDDIIFIAENGAVVRKGNQELSTTPLNRSLIDTILSIISGIDGASAMLCAKYVSYFDGNSVPFLDQLKEYYTSYKVVDNYRDITDEVVKIAVYHDTNAEHFIYPKVAHLNNKVKVKVSGPNWLDLNHINADKGNALKKVIALYGIKPSELLVFGDYNNDLEMIQMANHSFAMANAHASIKKAANFETSSNDDFGVERILEKLL